MLGDMREWFMVAVLLYAASAMLVNPSQVLNALRSVARAATTLSLHLQGFPVVPDHRCPDPVPDTLSLRRAVRMAGVLLLLPAIAAVVTLAAR